jgi:hypothetical protein
MSKVRKAKKLRQPNVPMSTGPTIAVGGGAERAAEARSSARPEAGLPEFDYTNTRKDLTRIGILAGTFITILVILSFFIR